MEVGAFGYQEESIMVAQSAAERQRKRRQRKSDKGLVKVEVWVPVGTAHIVKELEKKLASV